MSVAQWATAGAIAAFIITQLVAIFAGDLRRSIVDFLFSRTKDEDQAEISVVARKFAIILLVISLLAGSIYARKYRLFSYAAHLIEESPGIYPRGMFQNSFYNWEPRRGHPADWYVVSYQKDSSIALISIGSIASISDTEKSAWIMATGKDHVKSQNDYKYLQYRSIFNCKLKKMNIDNYRLYNGKSQIIKPTLPEWANNGLPQDIRPGSFAYSFLNFVCFGPPRDLQHNDVTQDPERLILRVFLKPTK